MSIPKAEGEADGKADIDGGWLTLRWDGQALRVQFAARLVGGKTLQSWLDDITAVFLQVSAASGIEVDRETIRAKMVTSRRERWDQAALSWTGDELAEILRRADAAKAAAPAATAGSQ